MPKKIVKRKKIPLVRINTRLRPSQHKYIKTLAKKEKVSEGKIFRTLIDNFIHSTKK